MLLQNEWQSQQASYSTVILCAGTSNAFCVVRFHTVTTALSHPICQEDFHGGYPQDYLVR